MKFNVEIDLDYIDRDSRLSEEIRSHIYHSVVDRICTESRKEIGMKISEEIEKQLAPLIEKTLSEPFHIFNRYGAKTTEVPVELTTIIRESAINYATQKVDSKTGAPTTSSYDATPRVEFMMKKFMTEKFDAAFKTEFGKIADEAKQNAIKKAAEVMAEVMAKRLGEK